LPPEISIITVYYNTPDELLSLSRSIRQFLRAGSYEWIVIDNHSAQDLSSSLPETKYLRMSENLGFAAASNRGAAMARSSYLFFVNPDCEFITDCIGPLRQALQSAGVAGPKVLNSDGSIQLSFGPFLSITSEALQKIRTRFEKIRWMQSWLKGKASRIFHPDYVSGCALMIRTDVFRELGGFDENFFLYEEDVDLCKRALGLKGPVAYVPEAKIMHVRNRSVRHDPKRANLEYRRSQIYYYRKHNTPLQNVLLRIYLALNPD